MIDLGDATDEVLIKNAIPMSSAGAKICGNQAMGTPEVNEDSVPVGYTLFPFEFKLGRGDVAALNAGDRVICTNATVLALRRP